MDPIPSTITRTTVVQPVDAYAILEKKRYQRRILQMHNIFLCTSDLSLLDDHGSLDQLVEIVETVDRAREKSPYQSTNNNNSTASNTVREKYDISEGQKEDEKVEDDNEEDSYVFDSPSEDESDEQSNQCGCCMFLDEDEEHNFIQIYVLTQTTYDLATDIVGTITNITSNLLN
jgi:hypothetical protein